MRQLKVMVKVYIYKGKRKCRLWHLLMKKSEGKASRGGLAGASSKK